MVLLVALLAACERRAPPAARPAPPREAPAGAARPDADRGPRVPLFAGLWERGFGHGNNHRNEALLLFADGTFERRAGGYELLPEPDCALAGPVAVGGRYRVEGSALVLDVRWEDHVRGGTRATSDDPSNPCRVRGGTLARADLAPPRAETLPLDRCPSEAETPCLRLGDAAWYRTGARGADPREAWYAFCAQSPLPVCDARR